MHAANEESVEEARNIAPLAVAILLDSGSPRAAIKMLGGTGKTHNWELSREIVGKVSIPVFLAGGLTATNVQEAIKTVRPYGWIFAAA